MMPRGWQKKTLGEVSDLTMGFAFKSSDFVDSGIPLIRMGNLYQNELNLERNPVYLPERFLNEFQRFQIHPHDILISMTGTAGKQDYGYAVIVPPNSKPLLLNQRVTRVRANGLASQSYLLYAMRSTAFTAHIYSKPGGTKQANISISDLAEIEIVLPPKEEQEKIAKILSTWDEAIERLEKLITIKSDRYTHLRDLLTNPTRPRWSGVFNDLAIGYNGLSGKSKKDFIIGNKKYITYNSVFRKSRVDFEMCELVSVSDNEKQNKVLFGDILFTGSSETPEEVGMSSVFLDRHDDIYLNSFCFGFRLNNFEILTPNYARHYFRSKKIRSQIVKLGQGATRYNLSRERMTQLKIFLPSKSDQEKISKALDDLLHEVAILQRARSFFSLQKKGLMQQLLTGKKRVRI